MSQPPNAPVKETINRHIKNKMRVLQSLVMSECLYRASMINSMLHAGFPLKIYAGMTRMGLSKSLRCYKDMLNPP